MELQVGPTGKTVGIDHIPELVNMSVDNVRKHHGELLDSGRLKLIGKLKENFLIIFILVNFGFSWRRTSR